MVSLIIQFQQKRNKSKGLALTISAVLTGLFFIGATAFLYWFLLSRFLEIHISVAQSEVERHALNLANVLISSEYLAYTEDGKIYRGLLDSRKLDLFAGKRGGTLDVNTTEYMGELLGSTKEFDLGYPNTINLINVIDLETCGNENCTIWSASLLGPTTIEKSSIMNFLDCLKENFKTDVGSWSRRAGGCVGGAIIGGIIGGPIGAAIGCGVGFIVTLWEPQDISKCFQNHMPESLKNFFYTGSPITYEGLPVIIRYPDGTRHVGRINVGVFEWS